jgi:probable F420-dependent oxidoreductase
VSRQIEAVLPFWLDRPDDEAIDIALAAGEAGLRALWIGEMATFDAVALATAIGLRAPGLRLKIGPMAIGVRSPVSIALAASSVATLTGCHVDVALGASSPAIVSGWHDREWAHSAMRMEETIGPLRSILAGHRSDHDGRQVRTHGFRLRRRLADARICVAAFGPAMTRVAARHADEIVVNLVPPERLTEVRATVATGAASVGRAPPPLTVWLTVALDPGAKARAQLAAQLSIYLSPPGYGEMFSELGFSDLVQRARAGVSRSELAQSIPDELLAHVCALGSRQEVADRISAYFDAGADVVAVAPSTAEDSAGRAVMHAIAETFVSVTDREWRDPLTHVRQHQEQRIQ